MEAMPEDAAQEPQAGAEGGNDVATFVQNLGQGISTLGEIVAKTEGAPPEASELVQGIMQQFQQLVQVMSGGGEQAQSQEQPSQKVPIQAPEGTPI